MILVTGGTGFIGSHLLDHLSAASAKARCLVRPRKNPLTLPPGIELAYGDLSTGDGVEAALRDATVVIHLAGVTKALGAQHYYAGNARGTATLAKAMAGRNIRFVHVSSLAAGGPSADGIPVLEDQAAHPVSDYGRSKLEAERIVRDLFPAAVIIRPPVVYGPRDTDVFQLLKSISRGWMLQIAGCERWFSAIFVKDLVEGLLAAASHPDAAGRLYYMAHRKPVSWSDFGETAGSIMGCRLRVVRAPLPAARAMGVLAEVWAHATRKPGIISRDKITESQCQWWTCDSSRAASELGVEANTSLENGLAQTLAWYKKAGWLKY